MDPPEVADTTGERATRTSSATFAVWAATVSMGSIPTQGRPSTWVRERPDFSAGAGATLPPIGRLRGDALVVSYFEAPPQKLKLLSKRTDFS